jgi:hypothetical protein
MDGLRSGVGFAALRDSGLKVARAFGTSWECVYRSAQWFVEWGLAHRVLEGIQAIGIDEILKGQEQAGG